MAYSFSLRESGEKVAGLATDFAAGETIMNVVFTIPEKILFRVLLTFLDGSIREEQWEGQQGGGNFNEDMSMQTGSGNLNPAV